MTTWPTHKRKARARKAYALYLKRRRHLTRRTTAKRQVAATDH